MPQGLQLERATVVTARRAGRAARRWLRARPETLWLFAFALLVRALAAVANPALLNDSVTLLRAAERLGDAGPSALLAATEHPLPPALIWAFSWLGPPEAVATALAVLAGAAAVWPLHVIARRACGRHAATGACVVYAALPKAVGVASVPLSTGFLLPLLLGAFSFAAAAGAPASPRLRTLRLAGVGVCGGLAYLCRPEGLVAGATAVVGLATQGPRGRRLRRAAIAAAALAAIAGPYVLALSLHQGHLAVSPKKDVARVVGLGASSPHSEQLAEGLRAAASGLEGALTVPALLLVALGGFPPTRWRHPHSRHPRWLLLGTSGVLLALVVRLQTGWDYASARHVLPAALLLLPFAGEGMVFLGGFIGRATTRRRLVLALAFLLALPLATRSILRPEGQGQVGQRRLGEALAAAALAEGPAPDIAIATFKEPLVAWYADRSLRPHRGRARDVPLWGRHRAALERSDAQGARADLVAALHAEGARWLVLDVFSTGRPLAERLRDDGVIGSPVLAAGGTLAASPVRDGTPRVK